MSESQVDNTNETAGSTDELEAVVDGLTPEQKTAALKAARAEAAGRRVAEKDLKEQLAAAQAQLDEIKKGQMSEIDREKATNAELKEENRKLKLVELRRSVAKEVLEDTDLADLLAGETKEEMQASATLLKSKLSPQGQRATASDMFAGVRGAPVGESAEDSEKAWFKSQFAN